MEQVAKRGNKTGLIIALAVIAGVAGLYFLNKKKAASPPATVVSTAGATNTGTGTSTGSNTGPTTGSTSGGNGVSTTPAPISDTGPTKYSVGQLLQNLNADGTRVHTISAITNGYYVMTYDGGGPLTIGTAIVDNDTDWTLCQDVAIPPIVTTPAPVTTITIIPPSQTPVVNGTEQVNNTPDAGNGAGSETIFSYGLGTDAPYQIINGQVVYI